MLDHRKIYVVIATTLAATTAFYVFTGELIHALFTLCESAAYASLSHRPVAPLHSMDPARAVVDAQEGEEPTSPQD